MKTDKTMQKKISTQQLQSQIAAAARRQVNEMTPEEKQEQFNRMVHQNIEAWTTAIVFNAVRGNVHLTPEDGRKLVDTAVETAYEMLYRLRGVIRKDAADRED